MCSVVTVRRQAPNPTLTCGGNLKYSGIATPPIKQWALLPRRRVVKVLDIKLKYNGAVAKQPRPHKV